jgi:hypothetical protein
MSCPDAACSTIANVPDILSQWETFTLSPLDNDRCVVAMENGDSEAICKRWEIATSPRMVSFVRRGAGDKSKHHLLTFYPKRVL